MISTLESSKRLITMIHHRHLLMSEIHRLIKAAKTKNKSKIKNHRGSFLAQLIKSGEPLKDRLFLKENPYY